MTKKKAMNVIAIFIICGTFVGLGCRHGNFRTFFLERPTFTGMIERLTGWDVTQAGGCRRVNTTKILKEGKGQLVVGYVLTPDGKRWPHLWGEAADGNIVDLTCRMSNPACRNRIPLADLKLEPGLPITLKKPRMSEDDLQMVRWGCMYLEGFLWRRNYLVSIRKHKSLNLLLNAAKSA